MRSSRSITSGSTGRAPGPRSASWPPGWPRGQEPLTAQGALEILNPGHGRLRSPKRDLPGDARQIDKTISVIQDFLSYARPKPPRFSRTAPDSSSRRHPFAKTQLAAGHQVPFPSPEQDILICLDADRMQEVILNLLLNSIAAIEERGNYPHHPEGRAGPGPGTSSLPMTAAGSRLRARPYLPSVLLHEEDGTGLALDLPRRPSTPTGGDLRPEPGGEGDDLRPPSAARPAVRVTMRRARS